jgi:hypothetical protein
MENLVKNPVRYEWMKHLHRQTYVADTIAILEERKIPYTKLQIYRSAQGRLDNTEILAVLKEVALATKKKREFIEAPLD